MDAYQVAERMLVEEVGGLFVWHTVLNQMWKSKVKGEALEPNRFGYSAWRGEQVGNTAFTLYIAQQSSPDSTGSLWERWFVKE